MSSFGANKSKTCLATCSLFCGSMSHIKELKQKLWPRITLYLAHTKEIYSLRTSTLNRRSPIKVGTQDHTALSTHSELLYKFDPGSQIKYHQYYLWTIITYQRTQIKVVTQDHISKNSNKSCDPGPHGVWHAHTKELLHRLWPSFTNQRSPIKVVTQAHKVLAHM